MATTTSVQFDPSLSQKEDHITINNKVLEGETRARLVRFLDRVRILSQVRCGARVSTENDFPTSAGLASSASGFAALALAASRAAGLKLDHQALSILARLGSGSAARSIHGGWVEMLPGQQADGSDSYARAVAPAAHWDLRCLVAVCDQGPKSIGSTEAMQRTASSSPYYKAWLEDVPAAVNEALESIKSRDFERLAAAAEASCLRMHASAAAAAPGILYWRGATVELIHRVRELRARHGVPVFFTIDAGPHLKAFCPPEVEARVASELAEVAGVLDLLHARGGSGARLLS